MSEAEMLNRAQPAAQTLGVSAVELLEKLAEKGISGDVGPTMLGDEDVFKLGDLIEMYPDLKDRMPVARMALKFLRGGKKASERPEVDARTAELQEAGHKVKLSDAPTSTLIKLYRPKLASDPVTRILKERFGDMPILAFKDDGELDVEETISVAEELELNGDSTVEEVMVDGKLTKLLPVGARPDLWLDEDPLYPGVPLRREISTRNHISWAGVSIEQRQLIRIALEHELINPDSPADMSVLATALTDNKLAKTYPKADMDFRDRKQEGTSPRLRIRVGGSTKVHNPFGQRRSY